MCQPFPLGWLLEMVLCFRKMPVFWPKNAQIWEDTSRIGAYAYGEFWLKFVFGKGTRQPLGWLELSRAQSRTEQRPKRKVDMLLLLLECWI